MEELEKDYPSFSLTKGEKSLALTTIAKIHHGMMNEGGSSLLAVLELCKSLNQQIVKLLNQSEAMHADDTTPDTQRRVLLIETYIIQEFLTLAPTIFRHRRKMQFLRSFCIN